MKRKALLVVASVAAVLASLVVVSVSAAAHPSGAASFNLYAGKTTDVGDVFVWNDATNLYVEIDLADGWCMTESHVAAALTDGGIPQNSQHNPTPGQFPYGDTYNPCESDGDTFTIPLAVLGATPVIAVHAKVWEEVLSHVSAASAVGDDVYGPNTGYDPPGSLDYGPVKPAVVPTFATEPTVWPTGSDTLQLAGASWISTASVTEVAGDSWRWHRKLLNVPGWPVAGSVTAATADNAERFWHNGVVRGSDGEVDGAFIDNYEWGTVESFTFPPNMGANTLDFVWRNYGVPGLGTTNNPNGLIYKATIDYYAHSESAWAGTSPFTESKSWATYFSYTVRHGVMSNQNGYGAEFSAFGNTGHLKFYAVQGSSGTLGDLDWKYGDPSSPTFAFSGVITSAVKSAGVWALVTDITQVTAAGGTTISDACTITFYVQDGTPDQVGGWMWWSAPPSCNYGTATGPYPLTYGFINEF